MAILGWHYRPKRIARQTRAFVTKNGSAPFIWDMVRYCLEMPYGGVKHFPAGTYNRQIETWTGRKELYLMNIVHSIWFMFKHLSMGDWGENERKLAKWMMPKKKEPEPPTRRVDDLILNLWGGSSWAYRVLVQLRMIDA